MKAIEFLKNKGITKATCYTDSSKTYYVNELAELIEEYAALHQPLVSGSLPCHHNYIQKDTYWKSCTHCGMIAPLGQ